jgi:hypothetical protein
MTSRQILVVAFTTVLLACGGGSPDPAAAAADPGTAPVADPAPAVDPPPVVSPPADPAPVDPAPIAAPECKGTMRPSDFPEVQASFFCTPDYARLDVDLARRAFLFPLSTGVNTGDGRLPAFTFAAPPVAGQTYTFADLSRFEAYLWWTRPGVDDLYMFVASKNALTPEPTWGSAAIRVTSVVPPALEGGAFEVHGTFEIQLAPHPASLSLVVHWDDPAAKLPVDATGTVLLAGSF